MLILGFVYCPKRGDELPASATLEMASEVGAVTLNYGQFITDLISFLLLALGVFLIIKGVQKLKKEEKVVEEKPTEKTCPFCQENIPVMQLAAHSAPLISIRINHNEQRYLSRHSGRRRIFQKLDGIINGQGLANTTGGEFSNQVDLCRYFENSNPPIDLLILDVDLFGKSMKLEEICKPLMGSKNHQKYYSQALNQIRILLNR